ncbi:MAG TPA: hypothetical protein VIV14_12095 [Gammaproteobacteria bacterium]
MPVSRHGSEPWELQAGSELGDRQAAVQGLCEPVNKAMVLRVAPCSLEGIVAKQ